MPKTLCPMTNLALDTYRRLELAKRRVERLTTELHAAVVHVPLKDLAEYVRVSDELEAKYAE